MSGPKKSLLSFSSLKEFINNPEIALKHYQNLHKILLTGVLISWWAVIGASFIWNFIGIKKAVMEIARHQLLSIYNNDLAYRHWIASVGGLYGYTEAIKPNPYLPDIPGREIITKDGKELTLINPAYLTRLAHEASNQHLTLSISLISLKSLNPINSPDEYEKKILLEFKKGKKEFFGVIDKDGKRYITLIRPLLIEKPCLKCHGQQGYKAGDIKGALCIKTPFKSYLSIMRNRQLNILIIHLLIGIIGSMTLIFIFKLIAGHHKTILEEKERLRTLMNAMPDLICFKDGEGRWLEANEFDLNMFGLNGVEYRGKKDSELAPYSPFYKDAFLTCEKTDELAWRQGTMSRADEVIPLPDGGEKIFDVIKVPLFYEDGRRKGLLVVGRDITEQRKITDELKRIYEFKELILNLAIEFINVSPEELDSHIDRSLQIVGEFLGVDRAYLIRVGYNNAFFITNEWTSQKVDSEGLDNLDRKGEPFPLTLDEFSRLLHDKYDFFIKDVDEIELKRLNLFLSSLKVKSFCLFPIRYQNDLLGGICLELFSDKNSGDIWKEDYVSLLLKFLTTIYGNAIIKDNILKKLEESEKRYRELFTRIPTGLYRNTPGKAGRFLMINNAAAEMFGYDNPEEMLHIDVSSLYPDPSKRIEVSDMLIRDGSIRNYELQLKKRDGTLFWVSVNADAIKGQYGNVLYFEGVVHDITKRKQAELEKAELERQLQQAQKLESIGRLAGGIAHDLNNLLVPILNYSELLMTQLTKDTKEYQYIKHIIEASEKGKEVIRQILAFSRKETFNLSPIDLNKLISEFKGLLERTLNENITLKIELADGLPLINADKGQIEQVILNLAVNAQDAMPNGGQLTIETSLEELNEKITHLNDISYGEYVCLTVKDTGQGIDEETLKYIFDPFFTTKPKGIGTGLGLSTVYGIIKQHKGHITVESRANQGSTFKIYLPAILKPYDNLKKDPDDKAIFSPDALKGTETILLAEDDVEVKKLVASILREYGYNVLEAGLPSNAVKIANDYDGKIDLLLTDVMMPEKNGKELYEELKRHFKGLKVIYMSGYAENIIRAKDIIQDGADFISKPFSYINLLKILRKNLKK